MILSVLTRRNGLAALIVLCQPLTTPVHGCSPASACGGGLDGFFLGLIAWPGGGSGANGVSTGTAAATTPSPPAAPTVSPLPPGGGPVVIPPATDGAVTTPAPATEPEPTRPYVLEQLLVTGLGRDGGESWMGLQPSDDGGAPQAAAPPLVRTGSFDGAEEWERTHSLALPVFPAWPTQPVSQRVAMSLGCGACGDGAYAELTGVGVLEFALAGPTAPEAYISRIRDIDLRDATGRDATGEIRFVLRGFDGPVATAEDARLLLDFGDGGTDIRLRMLLWLHADGRAGGAFAGMADDPDAGPGAIVGHFSGVGCAPACGAGN